MSGKSEIIEQVRASVTGLYTDVEMEFDIEAIAAAVNDRFGPVDLDQIDTDQYWAIVSDHTIEAE